MKKLLASILISAQVFASFPGDFPADAGSITIPALTVTGALSSGTAAVTGALTADSAAITGAVTAGSAAITGAVTAASGTYTAGDSDDIVLALRSATDGIVRWDMQEGSSNTYFQYSANFAGANAILSLNSVLAGSGGSVFVANRVNNTFLTPYDVIADSGFIGRSVSTGTMELSGDLDNDLGANLKLWAFNHATAARDWALRFDSTNVFSYDHSATDMHAAVPVVFAQGFRHTSSATELTADDQALSVASKALIFLTSDDGTAANRTFTLTGGEAGQVVTLYWNDTDEGELADTGTTLLTAAWAPTNVGESLVLVFDGTNYTEISRAAP